MSTFDIGLFNNSYTVTDAVSLASPNDLYNFTLASGGGLQASFGGMSFPLNWQVKDSGGSTLQSGLIDATNPEAINLYNLAAGNYSLQVSQAGGDTAYNLKLDPLTSFNFDSGFFTVEQRGQVSVDFLIDGGWYEGELALFSMKGIDKFNPGSEAFIKETTRRALTNSTEGYVVISDPTEGAKLTSNFALDGNFNAGEYKGIKTFAMTPGDKFGILMVPNGTVQEVFNNPSMGGDKRPLFSLATANPNDAFHVGQIADVTKDGKTFAMEDLRSDLGSDKDYNDFIFRVVGARGVAIALDEVIDPQKDWRGTTVGTDLRNYVNTPPQFLQFKLNSSYRVGETVNLTDAKVFDENGDISKVVFKLKQADGSEVTNEINNFTFNEDWASFNYALSGLAAGSYELTAIASDQLGQSTSPFTQSFQVQRVNNTPSNLQFTILQSTYNIGDSINLVGAKVYDADGISDLAKVDFEIKKDSGELVQKQSVTNFTSDSGDNRWGNFSYSLSGLGVGSYELRAIASDNSGAFSNTVSKNFTVNAPVVVPPNTPPEFLQFSVLPSYNLGETVNLIGGKVYDANGFSDLRIVDFELQKDGGGWENISDVISFTAESTDNRWGNFNYALSGLGLGSYVVRATAYDQSSGSNTVTASFTINPAPNRAPEGLEFSILPIYTNDETIRFNGGKVFDSNGVGDIDQVDFWLRHPDGTWFDIADATQFTADSKGRGRFNYSYDLKGLAPGRYQLWAIANDKSYNYSQPFFQDFSVITAAGESELADEERIAIANAANLNKYTPEELAKTREWVVWVTPGQSSTDLAQQIAAQDKGATGYIPNTYTWEFPEDISVDEVMRRLNSVRGVELYYPLVPLESELLSDPLVQKPGNLNPTYPLSDPNDPNLRNFLNSYQWHLRTGMNPSADANVTAAWNLAKGNGVVIGIVDDGLDFSHPDLRDRYRADLSWDFNEYDENPSPSYNRTIFASDLRYPTRNNNHENLPYPIRDIGYKDFLLNVPLTGVVIDANVRLNITHLRVSDLQALVNSPNAPVFNPLIGAASSASRRIVGGNGEEKYPVLLFDSVGGDGDNLTNTTFDDQANQWISQGVAPFSGSFKPLGRLADFNQQWAQGLWNLRVEDRVPRETGWLNDWGLELQTYNPHGTPVAGIAAASDNNGIDGSGVAPLASWAGLRLFADAADDLQIAGALSYKRQDIDIYNSSWKLKDWLTKSPEALRAMRAGVNFGRATLGSIYVFGAGNDQWGGGNVNYNGFANSRYALPVAAIDHTGKQTIYSEPGASLLVSAYSSSSGVGITTTDLTGNNGYAATDYTSRFGGTSASAPFVSGVVALMLEANPTLSWRDVQHILVQTAKKNDPTDFDWKTNGAGYHINHKYGFGAVDAEAAVRLAQSWASVGNETMVSSNLQNVLEDVPDGDEQIGVSSSVLISEDIIVEKVEVLFNTDHRDWRDLKVVLKSPDGTESILANSISSDPNAENSDQLQGESGLWSFTSARHWGESSKGEWQLQVFDREGNQIQGEWNTWKLNLYGAKPTVTISATDANATEGIDPGQFTVTRTGNTKYALTVNYSLAGNATNGTDYDALSGSIVIPAGQSTVTIPIRPIDDGVSEGNEAVVVNLTASNAYDVAINNSGRVAIADNEIPIELFTDINAALERVSNSSVDWGDYDNDGDLDILLTGTIDPWPSTSSVLKVYRNNNGSFIDIGANLQGVARGGYNSSVKWRDYDNDGDLDILLMGTNGSFPTISLVSKVYRNDKGTFTDFNINLEGVKNFSSVDWGDYDNDGDLDILLTGSSTSSSFPGVSKVYRNDKGNFTDINANLENISDGSVQWGDYDNDGDLDILLTGISATSAKDVSKVYRNEGNNSFTDIGANLQGVYFSSVDWGDYDNDGDLDILLTGWTNIEFERPLSKVYRNDNGSFTDIGADLLQLWGSMGGTTDWGDYDNDGDLDILLTGSGVSKVYSNNNGTFADINANLQGVWGSSVKWGDYDNDGDLDILLTGALISDDASKIYRNNTLTANTAPTAPTNLNTSVNGTSVTFNWNRASDAQTPQNGLTYNLRVGTTPGGSNIMSPMALGNGTRQVVQMGNVNQNTNWTLKNLQPGTYYWSVQAVDTAFAGSNFAREGSFTVTRQPRSLVSIGAVQALIPETEGSSGQFMVTRRGDTSTPLLVNYTVGGTATNGTDYQPISGNITIEAGSATATIPINIIDDTVDEGGEETVVINLAPDTSYDLDSPSSSIMTIYDGAIAVTSVTATVL